MLFFEVIAKIFTDAWYTLVAVAEFMSVPVAIVILSIVMFAVIIGIAVYVYTRE